MDCEKKRIGDVTVKEDLNDLSLLALGNRDEATTSSKTTKKDESGEIAYNSPYLTASVILGLYASKVCIDLIKNHEYKKEVKMKDGETTERGEGLEEFQYGHITIGAKESDIKYDSPNKHNNEKGKPTDNIVQGFSVYEYIFKLFGVRFISRGKYEKALKNNDNDGEYKRVNDEIKKYPYLDDNSWVLGTQNNKGKDVGGDYPTDYNIWGTGFRVIVENFDMRRPADRYLCFWHYVEAINKTFTTKQTKFKTILTDAVSKLVEDLTTKMVTGESIDKCYIDGLKDEAHGVVKKWNVSPTGLTLQDKILKGEEIDIVVNVYSNENKLVGYKNLFKLCDEICEKNHDTYLHSKLISMAKILSTIRIVDENNRVIIQMGTGDNLTSRKSNNGDSDVKTHKKYYFTLRCYEDGRPYSDNIPAGSSESAHVVKQTNYYYMNGDKEIDLTEKIRERIGNEELKRAVTIEYKGEDCEVMIRPDSVRRDDGRVECVLYPIRYTVDYQVGMRLYRQSEKDPTLIKNIYNNLSEIREKLAESSYDMASELENGNGLDAFHTDVMKIMGDFDVSIPELNDVRDDDAEGNDSTSSGDSSTESADCKRIDYHDYHSSEFEQYAKTGFAFVEEVTPGDPRLKYDFPEDNEKYKVRVNVGMDLPPHVTVLELGYKGVGKTNFTLNLKSVFEEHELREILDRNVTLRMFWSKTNSNTREIGLRKFTVKNSNAELRFIDLPGGIVDDELDRTTVWNIEQVVLRNPDYIFFFHDLSEYYNKDGESRFKEIFNKIIGKYDDARKPPVLHIYTKRDRLDAGQLQSRFDIPSKPGKELTVDDCIKIIHERNKYVAGTKYKDGACLSGFGYEDYIPVDAIKSLAEALRGRI